MRRNVVAVLAAVVAIGFMLLGMYEAFTLLVPVVPRGTSLGLVLLVLGIVGLIGCAAIACAAGIWLESLDRSQRDIDQFTSVDSVPSVLG
jgi:hypothetical protein